MVLFGKVIQVSVVEIRLVLFYSVNLGISPCTTSFGQGFILVSVSGVVLCFCEHREQGFG